MVSILDQGERDQYFYSAVTLYAICCCCCCCCCYKKMEKRFLLGFGVAFVFLSIFLNSDSVHCHSRDPFKSILGQVNTGSWKDRISSSGEAPGPANDMSTLVLAQNRTKRPDIHSGFHKYRGGWDISNKHYWASVGFTGATAFVLAVLWFILFGFALLVYYCCRWTINIGGKNSSWSLRKCILLLTVFAATTVIGCIILSVGQVKLHGETLDTLNYVVNQSQYTVNILRNVTDYLSLAKSISVAQFFLSADIKDDIDRLNVDLNTAADMVEDKTQQNSGEIQKDLNAVRILLFTIAAVMLLISILGLVLSICGHQRLMCIFIISAWLLIAVTVLLCGFFVVLQNAITDTCLAMAEWVENPHAETALSNILPCVDQKTTNQTLFKSKQVVIDIVNIINTFVASVANSNPPPKSTPSYYNQSGPRIPFLCYPYDSQLQDRNCSAQELPIQNASLVWQNYTCSVSANGTCTSVGRLTPDMYTELVGAVNESYALEHYTPLLLNLQNCNFVRDTFRNITSNYCPPLKLYLRIVNAGLAVISAGVMLSLVLWILYANCPQRGKVFDKHSSQIRGRTNRATADTASMTST